MILLQIYRAFTMFGRENELTDIEWSGNEDDICRKITKFTYQGVTYTPVDAYRYADTSEFFRIFDLWRCNECNVLYPLDDDHIRYYDSEIGDDYPLCHDCFSNLRRCSHCDCVLTESQEYYDESGDVYCEDCYDDIYTNCDCCENELRRDSIVNWYYDDIHYKYICDDCVNDIVIRGDGWVCSCGSLNSTQLSCCGLCHTPREPHNDTPPKAITCNCIRSYHPVIALTPFDDNNKIVPIDTFKGYGIELEVNRDDIETNSNWLNTLIPEINKFIGTHAYYSWDGSVYNGFEIVTQPHSEKAMRDMKWKELFEYLTSQQFTKESCKCGYHIHISKTLLGDTDDEIRETISKLIYFFEAHKTELIKLSRRTDACLRWCRFYSDVNNYGACVYRTDDVEKQKLCNIFAKDNKIVTRDKTDAFVKYATYNDAVENYSCRGAINLNCYKKTNTIEIRLFRSTLDYDDFIGIFDFVTTLIKNARRIKWQSINRNVCWLKGLSDKGKAYIKKYKVLGVK